MRLSHSESCKLLGITHLATEAEIKAAWKSKAKQFHPDLNSSPTAHQQFVQLQQAYNVCMKHSENPLQIKVTPTSKEQARTYEQQFKKHIREKQFRERVNSWQKNSKPSFSKIFTGVSLILLSLINLWLSKISFLGLVGLLILRLGVIMVLTEWRKRNSNKQL